MVNKVILVGYLGGDPEVRYLQDGTQVANFSMATSQRYKDAQGQAQEKTEWHRVVAWKRLAEICAEYLKKGRLVYIEGRLQTRKWQDKDGQDRYTTEVVAQEMKMLGGKGDGQGKGQPARTTAQSGPDDDFKDDIPF